MQAGRMEMSEVRDWGGGTKEVLARLAEREGQRPY